VVAELVRCLSQAGVVSRDTMAQALLEASREGVHVLQKLASRHASVIPILEVELARGRHPTISGPLAIDYVQVLRLPIGLCKRLLAVPLQVDPTSSRWAVAAAEASDRHLAAEISYHLGGPVDVKRAPLSVILTAVALTEERPLNASLLPLMDSDIDEEHTPAFGTAAIMRLRRPSARWGSSETNEPRSPTPRRGLSLPPLQTVELQSEPPIPLVRPLGPRSVEGPELTVRARDPEVLREPTKSDSPGPSLEVASPSDATPQEKINQVLTHLESKATAREVLQGFALAVSMVASRAAVFAVRAGQFHLEEALPARLSQSLSLGFDQSSVLNTACLAGYFLGPLARGTDSEILARSLDIELDTEIYVVPVVVAERPAAVIVAGVIENTFAATQLIDKVASRGGAILEQMIQRRRQKR